METDLDQQVTAIRSWLETQLHLPEIMDCRRITNFLKVNKFSIEKTKQKIEAYYTVRIEMPEMFSGGNPKNPKIKQLMDLMYWVALPKPAPNHLRVHILKMRQPENWKKLDPRLKLVHIMNSVEIRIAEDDIVNTIAIMDLEGVGWGYLTKYNPHMVLQCLNALERIYSIPVKAIYIINAQRFLAKFVAFLKTLMKPKIFERIQVLDNVGKLFEKLPSEILPKDYGGQEKSLEELNEMTKLKLLEYEERFNFLENMKVDDSLRPPRHENDEQLGYYGHFRKMSID